MVQLSFPLGPSTNFICQQSNRKSNCKIIVFNEHSLSTTSEPKTVMSHSITDDGCGLFKGWPIYRGPLARSQFGEISKVPGYYSTKAAIPADTMMEILKDLSESLEEGWLRHSPWTYLSHLTNIVCSIASGERSALCGCSPGRDTLSHVEEPKTQTGPSSNVNHEPQKVKDIHELFESCAETINNLLEMVDLSSYSQPSG